MWVRFPGTAVTVTTGHKVRDTNQGREVSWLAASVATGQLTASGRYLVRCSTGEPEVAS